MLWMFRRVRGDQRFHRRAADREEADQVFGRRQHGDVLDAFVVGLGWSCRRDAHTRYRWRLWLWRSLWCSSRGSKKEFGHKKTAGVSGGFGGVRSRGFWVRSDLSTAGGAGEPEVTKKIRASRMHGLQCSTFAGAARRGPPLHSRNFFHHCTARSTCGSSSAPSDGLVLGLASEPSARTCRSAACLRPACARPPARNPRRSAAVARCAGRRRAATGRSAPGNCSAPAGRPAYS